MTQWMQHEMAATGTVNDSMMQVWNDRIKKEQVRINNSQAAKVELDSGGTIIYKSLMSGSSVTVPDGRRWQVNSIKVREGEGSYEVVVKSIPNGKILQAGEKLITPVFCSEAHLIAAEPGNVKYVYEIYETDLSNGSRDKQ